MKSKNIFKSVVILFLALINSTTVFAWGKRGHEMVGSLSAQLLAEKHKGSEFLKNHSFDMGYYNNVPDIVWKSDPETYKKEFFQHFIDMEEFEGVKEWSSDKATFFKNHPKIMDKAGKSWWRIQGLNNELEKITLKLKTQKKLDLKEQHSLQSSWLLLAGVMGHYVADLSQPLHVTNNYDGQKTNQKGIHKWFEETLVDQLYPDIHEEVYKKAKNSWEEFHQTNSKLSVFELAQKMTQDSQSQIPAMLKIDKKIGRKDVTKSSKEYRQMIIDRLAIGTLYLAEIWSRQTGWSYNEDKFYNFNSTPTYINP